MEGNRAFGEIAYLCPLLTSLLLEIPSNIPWQKYEKDIYMDKMIYFSNLYISKKLEITQMSISIRLFE